MRLCEIVRSLLWANREREDNTRGISDKDIEETVLILTDDYVMDKKQLRRVTKKLNDRLAYEEEAL